MLYNHIKRERCANRFKILYSFQSHYIIKKDSKSEKRTEHIHSFFIKLNIERNVQEDNHHVKSKRLKTLLPSDVYLYSTSRLDASVFNL